MHLQPAALILALTIGASPQTPQTPPRDTRPAGALPVVAGTAAISGTITLMGSGQPVRRARVSLSAADGGGGRTTMTDELGRFSFDKLVAARYTVSASKPGHVTVVYGQPRPARPGTQIQLGDGDKFELKLEMPRGGVITGTVLDEHGDAIPGTQVRAMRFVIQGGQRTLTGASGGSTDDRGIYRIYGLQPGEYIVAATPRNNSGDQASRIREELQNLLQRAQAQNLDDTARRELTVRTSMLQGQLPELEEEATGYAPVFYPGTTTSTQAATIALGAGEERSGADFSLVRVSVATVEGTIVNPTNQPVSNIQVTLLPAGPAVPGVGNHGARAQQDGRFRIVNVPPGQYRISARAQVQNRQERVNLVERSGAAVPVRTVQDTATRLWAAADLAIDGRSVSNINLVLQQGTTVSGRIAFEGTKTPPTDFTRVRVSLSPADTDPASRGLAQPANGRVDASGKFTVTNVVPGRYRLTASGAGSGWSTESAVVEGQDSLDFPFEVKGSQGVTGAVITFTDQQSELSGTITDQQGQPAPGFTLIAFSSDERFWTPQSRRVRTTRPATDGRFTFTNLPPGDYGLAAVEDIEPGSWFDPEVLKQFDAASLRVTLSPGEKKVQSVRVAR
jgi:hypothetical protein